MSITGAAINTPGTLTFNADKLILGIQTTQTDVSNTSQGGDAAWIKNKGKGSSDQTTNYNQFNVGTLVTPVKSVQIGLAQVFEDAMGATKAIESPPRQNAELAAMRHRLPLHRVNRPVTFGNHQHTAAVNRLHGQPGGDLVDGLNQLHHASPVR